MVRDMRYVLLFAVLALFPFVASAQLQLVPGSFKQISNLDASNPNEWGDIDAHLLTREDKTDENGVKNALLKLKVDKISSEDMSELRFVPDQGVYVRWTQQGQTPGEMWLLITGIETSFKVVHPIFGESNTMQLDLKGLCSYELKLTNNETTTLTILSEPEGANIYLDGNWMGNATTDGCILKQVSFGQHRLKARLDGIEDSLTINVSEASQRSYKLEVYKQRDFIISSDPEGAVISIDGQQVGVAPLTVPLKLKYHLIEANLKGQYDKYEAKFDENMPNTINLTVVKHKPVQIAAVQAGRNITAQVHIDDQIVGLTPHTADIAYGTHQLIVSYGSKSKEKRIKVNDGSPTYYRFKFSTRNNFTWPWEKEYKVRPVGLSVGFVKKEYRITSDESDGHYSFSSDFWGEGSFIPGIQAGILIQPQFKYGFGLSTGLFYEYYWDKSNDATDEYGTFYSKFQEHSLYLPIKLEYRLVLAENFSLFVNGGISMDIGMAGSVGQFDEGESEPFYQDDHIYASDDWPAAPKRFNFSYEFGGGLQVYGVQLSFFVAKGLLDHSRQDGFSMKVNKPMMINLAYVFGGD